MNRRKLAMARAARRGYFLIREVDAGEQSIRQVTLQPGLYTWATRWLRRMGVWR